MATGNKFNAFVQNINNGAMNLSSDSLKVMLTNALPVATNSLYGDVSGGELSTANGYTVGGAAVTVSSSTQTGGVYKLIGTVPSPTWSATGTVGPFRYVILYDTTPTSPLKPLVCWWDYGSALTLNNGDTFTVTFDAVNGILQDS